MNELEKLAGTVADVYKWIDSQVAESAEKAGSCRLCGQCCDFERFGHKLFVSSPELVHFGQHAAGAVPPMQDGRCPYNIKSRCSVYDYRFAGCRIFCCNGDAGFQNHLSDSALRKLKAVCAEFPLPYEYLPLPEALSRLAVIDGT